jgi:hypothetical protein
MAPFNVAEQERRIAAAREWARTLSNIDLATQLARMARFHRAFTRTDKDALLLEAADRLRQGR